MTRIILALVIVVPILIAIFGEHKPVDQKAEFYRYHPAVLAEEMAIADHAPDPEDTVKQ